MGDKRSRYSECAIMMIGVGTPGVYRQLCSLCKESSAVNGTGAVRGAGAVQGTIMNEAQLGGHNMALYGETACCYRKN
ncbi:hypothetical protein B9D94_24925 [Paenibacillus sp. Cedars]|nr:hypothetical protein B9D94_24925 [Paenibacillus sp. Cedars]